MIRHTVTVAEKGYCYGQTDLDLQLPYLDVFQKIKGYLQINEDTLIYSSPLRRCVEMAHFLSPNAIFDDRIKELNFGLWENLKWDSIDHEISMKWMNDFVNEAPPEGESFQALADRVNGFIDEIVSNASFSNRKVVIVAHAGVIRALICAFLGIPLVNAFRLSIDFGSISCIAVQNGYASLQFSNKIL
ncbi:MAG: alpha-ribazole phosphatase family protein [Pseudarcicella sp.]|nr:alpha-ribazole phosphatase family protein [Pseudarcicella sp.]